MQLLVTQGDAAVDVSSAQTIATVKIGFKSGKSISDLTSTSIRFINAAECATLNQSAAIEITNGAGTIQQAIKRDGTANTLKVTPKIVWDGITPTEPPKPAYSGTIDAPTVKTNAGGKVELYAVTPTGGPGGETVQYGYSKTNDGKNITWQDGTTFSGLTVSSTLYFYAKVVETPSYAEKVSAASAAVTVLDKVLTNLKITMEPSTKTYTHGDPFKTDGMKVKATYSDGSSNDNFTGYTVAYETSGKGYLCKDNTKVTLKAGDKSVEVTGLTVKAKELTVTGLTAVDREYKLGYTLVNLTGGTLTGVVGSEDVSLLSTPTTGRIDNAGVGDNKNVSIDPLSLTGADAGNYTLTQPTGIKVNITQKNISGATITLGAQKTYNGSEQDVVISKVTVDGTDLTAGSDYTITSGGKATNVGDNTLVIKGTGNYKGTASAKWSLVAKDIGDASVSITFTPTSYGYTGSAINPSYTVKDNSRTLTVNNDYTANISDNTYVGTNTAKLTITGTGNYTGTKSANFTITAKDVSATRPVEAQTVIKNDGSFAAPTFDGVTGTLTYTYGGTTKTYDQIKSDLATKSAGDTATITYSYAANGNYTGTITGTINVTVVDVIFEVGGVTATVANALDIKADPTYGDDWSDIVKIKDGVTITARVGTATDTDQSHFILRPTGKPNAGNNQTYELVYNGTINGTNYANVVVVSGTVDVAQKDVTAAMIAGIPAQAYTGSAIQPKPAVTDGAALVEGTDFTYSYDANTDVAAGGKVTITGKGNYKGTADKTFTISPKNISGATINLTSASLPYSGLEQTVSITSVTLTGWTITAGDYDIVGNSDKATNVGSTTLTIQGKGNYTGTAATTWEITAIDPVLANFDVTPALSTAQTYDGAHKTVTVVPKSGVNGMGTVKVYYEATAGITYPKSETAPTDVGTYKVTASVAAGSNYNAKDIDVGTLTINQATGGTLAAYNFQQKYTDLTAKTITPDYSDLPAGQTWTYSVSAPVTSGTAAVTGTSIGADTGVLSYTLTAGAKDNTVKWTVTISSHNYADFTKEVTLTLTDKDDQTALTLTGGTTVVYGQTLQLGTSGGSGTGAVTYAVTNGTGEATIDATGKLTPVKVGTVKVKATKAEDANYNAITSAEVEITITRATPTGAPKYTAITTSGKTLADAGLTTTGSNLTPAGGKIEWVDNAGHVLPDTTTVEANKAYKWRYTPTPADAVNYAPVTGTIVVYPVSTGIVIYSPCYTIKATAGANGTISPAGWCSVVENGSQTFTFTPDKGYTVAKVLVDGKSVGAVKSYTFKNVTKDHTIEVIFMKSNGNPATGVFVMP